MTESAIYYFSGTGNSLAFASRLAERTEASLVPMTRILQGSAGLSPTRVGLVFPTYAYGLPRSVAEFVAKVQLPRGAYILGVTSCCGIPGAVLRDLDRALRARGHRLAAGFAVCDSRSSLTEDPEKDPIQRLMITVNRGRKPLSSEARLNEIGDYFAAAKQHPVEGSGLLVNIIGSLLHGLAARSFPSADQHLWSSDDCVGCGTCIRLCPRGNIGMEGGRPKWEGNCQLCHACIQWCPHAAIQYKGLTVDKPRYQNQAVSIAHMLEQSRAQRRPQTHA